MCLGKWFQLQVSVEGKNRLYVHFNENYHHKSIQTHLNERYIHMLTCSVACSIFCLFVSFDAINCDRVVAGRFLVIRYHWTIIIKWFSVKRQQLKFMSSYVLISVKHKPFRMSFRFINLFAKVSCIRMH